MATRIVTKRDKIADIIQTIISERLADPVRMVSDTEYCVAMISLYIEAANVARSMMNMQPINLDDYPD
jgi:hypothetical protein